MSDGISMEILGTYAGLVSVTAIITEFLRMIPGIKKAPAQIISFIVSFILMICISFINHTVNVESIILDAVNSIVISLGSNGVYDAVTSGAKKIKNPVSKPDIEKIKMKKENEQL